MTARPGPAVFRFVSEARAGMVRLVGCKEADDIVGLSQIDLSLICNDRNSTDRL